MPLYNKSVTVPVTATQGGTGIVAYTLGDILYSSASNTLAALAGNTSASIKILAQTGNGSVSAAPVWNATTGTGSVVMSASPTLTGTIGAAALTLSTPLAISSGGIGAATASANAFFVGPTSGGAAAPSFRAMVSADIPALTAVRAGASTSTMSTGTNVIVYATETYDTDNAYNNSTGLFTAQKNGKYRVFAQIAPSATLTTAQSVVIKIRKNGSVVAQSQILGNGTNSNYYVSTSDTVLLLTNDTIDIVNTCSVTMTSANSTLTDILTIEWLGN